nr:hypothetical protein [Tanacetum cinerariifolium]
AFGSQVTPPPPPPTSTNQDSPCSAAPSPSKTAATTEHQAWTTLDVTLKPLMSLTPADLDMDEAMGPDEQAQLSDEEDIRSVHIPTVNLRQGWWKPFEEERPTTPKPAWSIRSSDVPVPTNNWASVLASNYSPHPEDSLLAQISDIATFMDWFCKRRGITELKPQDLEGPAYEIVKVFHPDVIHLQYQMEECHKLLTGSVDDPILRHNVSKPLPLRGPPGQVTIQSDFFFNKDLEYLRYDSKGRRPALSISKMNAAYYPDARLEQMVPDQFWIEKECKYDIAAMYGISHWWFQRQRFYIDRHTSEGDRSIRVEDFQLGIENYQTQVNLTKPQWTATGFEYKHDYTVIESPRAVIFQDKYRVQMMMRFNEIYKFSDGTLQQIIEEGRRPVQRVHVRDSEAFEDTENLSQPGEHCWRTRQRGRLQTFEAYRLIKLLQHSRPLIDDLQKNGRKRVMEKGREKGVGGTVVQTVRDMVKKVNDVVQLRALIDGKKVVVSKAIIRRYLCLDDADGCLSAKRATWNEFSYSMASAVIFIATGGCIQPGGKIEAIDADEGITLVDVEKDEEVVAMDVESQERLNQEEVNAASKGGSDISAPELVIAAEPTIFDDEDKLHNEEVQKAVARDKQEKVDMERALELQRQYDEKEENINWSAVVEQKLYIDRGVHHVSSTRGYDIFMLIEQDYHLSNAVMILMLSGKLQVEKDNEMARDLVMKIFMKANKPKSRTKDNVVQRLKENALRNYCCWFNITAVGLTLVMLEKVGAATAEVLKNLI